MDVAAVVVVVAAAAARHLHRDLDLVLHVGDDVLLRLLEDALRQVAEFVAVRTLVAAGVLLPRLRVGRPLEGALARLRHVDRRVDGGVDRAAAGRQQVGEEGGHRRGEEQFSSARP